jgi:hypothetical protein
VSCRFVDCGGDAQAVPAQQRCGAGLDLDAVFDVETSAAAGAFFCRAVGTPAAVVDSLVVQRWCCGGLAGLLAGVRTAAHADMPAGAAVASVVLLYGEPGHYVRLQLAGAAGCERVAALCDAREVRGRVQAECGQGWVAGLLGAELEDRV